MKKTGKLHRLPVDVSLFGKANERRINRCDDDDDDNAMMIKEEKKPQLTLKGALPRNRRLELIFFFFFSDSFSIRHFTCLLDDDCLSNLTLIVKELCL